MSTAEAVSVFYQTMSSAYYYGDGKTDLKELTQNLLGAVCKENKDDLEKLKSYFRIAVKEKSASEGLPREAPVSVLYREQRSRCCLPRIHNLLSVPYRSEGHPL